MKKSKILITILFISVLVLSMLRVVVLNNISTSGAELNKTQEELNKLRTENTILKEKLLTLTSLDHISSSASTLGFVESKNSLSLNGPLPLAIKQ